MSSDEPNGNPSRSALATTLRLLGSLKLAVLLIVLLVVLLAGATFVETAKGGEYVQWHVYHSQWFIVLLAVLAVNILAATLVRFPWGLKRMPFLVTHAGLLVLLAGAIASFYWGIEGYVAIPQGETANTLAVSDRSQFTVLRPQTRGMHAPLPLVFAFSAGPSDWPEGMIYDKFERVSGIGLKVLKFYRHAEMHEDWVAAEAGAGAPAIKFTLITPDGQAMDEQWLAADDLRGPMSLGPAKFEVQRVPVQTMIDDLLKPPAADKDKIGILSIHYEGKVERVPVSTNLGKKVPLGDGKVSVEIVEYLADAMPGRDGKFSSRGDQPRNPLLELRVQLPGEEKPVRQLAFAKIPWLNLDGFHGRSLPVKFWFHHPAAQAVNGVEFVQAPDQKLYCRIGREGKYKVQGEVKTGVEFEFSPQFKIGITDYVPAARREMTYTPVKVGPNDSGSPEAAALVQVSVGEATQQVWLARNDPENGVQSLSTAEGSVSVGFGNERLPLGFSLQLLEFREGRNPGGMGMASYTSRVRVIDPAQNLAEDREISMNEPLKYGKFTCYQSSYQQAGDGKYVSILSVAYDPGRFLKYFGSVMICVGSGTMFCRKMLTFRKLPANRALTTANGQGRANNGDAASLHSRKELSSSQRT